MHAPRPILQVAAVVEVLVDVVAQPSLHAAGHQVRLIHSRMDAGCTSDPLR